jgi:hypothetical protein
MRNNLFRPALLALALAVISLQSLFAQSPKPWSFHSELDLFLGLKAGAEYRISDDWGIRGCVGAVVISPLTTAYSIVGVRHLREPESPLQLDLQFGLVQDQFNVLEPVFDLDPKISGASSYWGPGACVSIGYRAGAGHVFSFRAGAGLRFGYDLGSWQGPEFMPNIALEYGFRPTR